MIECFLFMNTTFLGTMMMPYPRFAIEVAFQTRIDSTAAMTSWGDSSATNTTAWTGGTDFMRSIFVFHLHSRIGFKEYRYQLVGDRIRDNNFRFITFINARELEDPTDEVNLDILKNKMRDNKRVKELLLEYYKS